MTDPGPDEHDADLMDEGSDDQIACPHCGAAVWADAEQCPSCGMWLTEAERDDAARGGRRWWKRTWPYVVGLMVVLLVWFLIVRL